MYTRGVIEEAMNDSEIYQVDSAIYQNRIDILLKTEYNMP